MMIPLCQQSGMWSSTGLYAEYQFVSRLPVRPTTGVIGHGCSPSAVNLQPGRRPRHRPARHCRARSIAAGRCLIGI